MASHPAKWPEFRRRCRAELRAHSAALQPLLGAARHGHLTLIYSSHDQQHNNAVVLEQYLESLLNRSTT